MLQLDLVKAKVWHTYVVQPTNVYKRAERVKLRSGGGGQ